MLLAKVIGTATATAKHETLHGWKLLVVQPYKIDGQTPDGDPVLAIDALGAGRDSEVMITSDGRSTRRLLGSDLSPVRWNVIGIRD